ncbi:uncharacterized protein MELLADRAFT_93501 [Melampsora larici-populina 98AG31]|uniref:C2H2-type domain-containing protein n=1 Tax=Melampsora larici-populina (strain 98AG31 / pathotype 3-4-7) TaxID=747676 RepID=F4RAM2_MELLP|nr:uncharacterized protein MELLADRAFT_93501 [Melampsora larici-populina 98AG31]EGG10506.1 hypothetical protein MELLADRAFT_93501 [Melampsora larici-populina 98AG31]
MQQQHHRRGRSESQIIHHFNPHPPNPNQPEPSVSPKLEEWEDIITRSRSYSHSSIGSSSAISKSFTISSRTTPATKAAANKRRKEGNEARYLCEMCGESFTRRYNLRGHQRAHKGEKPFACEFPGCTSSFARAHDQKRHYKLHLGIKDYNCKVCGKAFIRLDALQRHHKSDAGQGCFYELKSKGELSYEHDSNLSLPPLDPQQPQHQQNIQLDPQQQQQQQHLRLDSQPPPQQQNLQLDPQQTALGIMNPAYEFCVGISGEL